MNTRIATPRTSTIMKSFNKKSAAARFGRIDAAKMRAQAIEVAGVQTFPELAALLLARRLGTLNRRADARRVLLRYLAAHPQTAAIAAALQATA